RAGFSATRRPSAGASCSELSAEEREELLGDDLWYVFDEKMRGVGVGAAGDLRRVGAPEVQRLVVEAPECAVASPEGKDRAGDGSPSAVGVVELTVDRRAGPVVLAHRLHRRGVGALGAVGVKDLLGVALVVLEAEALCRNPERVRVAEDHPL